MDQVEKLKRWLFPIGGGAYGVKTLKPIILNEKSSLSVHVRRFTINAGLRYFYRGFKIVVGASSSLRPYAIAQFQRGNYHRWQSDGDS